MPRRRSEQQLAYRQLHGAAVRVEIGALIAQRHRAGLVGHALTGVEDVGHRQPDAHALRPVVLLEEVEILREVVEQPQVELGEAAEMQRAERARRTAGHLGRALPVGAQPEAEPVVAVAGLPLNLVTRLAAAGAGRAAAQQVARRDAIGHRRPVDEMLGIIDRELRTAAGRAGKAVGEAAATAATAAETAATETARALAGRRAVAARRRRTVRRGAVGGRCRAVRRRGARRALGALAIATALAATPATALPARPAIRSPPEHAGQAGERVG